MEIGEIIIGSRLIEIRKRSGEVKMIFENKKKGKTYELAFEGFSFEPNNLVLNRVVDDIQFNNTLGFQAISQLAQLNLNSKNYFQFNILMDEPKFDFKLEILGVYKDTHLSTKTTKRVVKPELRRIAAKSIL